MINGGYPTGSDNSQAPWNQKENPEKEIEVTVSITLSKTVKIKVSDYIIESKGTDEDGMYYENIDYSNCDLKKAIKEQIILPQNTYKNIMVNTDISKKAYQDSKDWNVDDLEVILE